MTSNQLIWRVYKKDSPKAPMLFIGTVLGNSEDDCRNQVAKNHWKDKFHEYSSEDNLIFLN